jgi:tetratricopeptide (TPR) repeat protein
VAEGERVRARWWVWPATIGSIGGLGTVVAVFAGRTASLPLVIFLAVAAMALSGYSTIYTVDKSHFHRSAASIAPAAQAEAGTPAQEADESVVQMEPAVLPQPKILVSFISPADRAWARWISRQLFDCGYLVSNRPWPAQPSKVRSETQAEQTDASASVQLAAEEWSAYQVEWHARGFDCVILLVSRAFVSARSDGHWWQRAVVAALAAAPPVQLHTTILPVLIEKCDPDTAEGLGRIVDLTEQDADGCKTELNYHLGQCGLPAPDPHAPTIDVDLPGRGPSLLNLRALDASFVGRRKDLDLLYALLHPDVLVRTADLSGRTTATPSVPAADLHAVVIHGMGGIGKTELALQYAWEHADEYDLIWWVQASTSVSAVNDLVELAKLLNLPERANHDEVIINLWPLLRLRDKWLLVLDDVDEPKSIRKAYWPTAKNGHVLITSRAATGWEILTSHNVKLGALTPQESEEFLTRRVPGAVPEITRQVAAALEYLPLALAQAAAFVLEAGSTLEEYHVLLREKFDEAILANETAGGSSLVPMLSARSREPAARDMLALLSMFGSTGIPRKMIAQHADVLPEQLAAAMTDEFTEGKTVRELSRVSLVEAFSDRFNVHSVVQSTMRNSLSAEEQRLWSRTAVRLLRRAFPREPEVPGSWSACAFLMPHVEAARQITSRLGGQDERTAHLLLLAGIYLHGRCDWKQAQTYLESAWRIRAALPVVDNLKVAECLYHLGQSQFPLAQLEEARASMKQALEIRQRHLVPAHPLIAEALIRLAEITREFGTENDEAIAYAAQAQRILEEVGANEAGIADALLIRGTILRNAGRLSAALRAQQESLELNERVRANGPSSVEAGVNHANIGVVYRDLGKWERAKDEFETALGIMEPVLGADHLEVAQVKKYLGDILRRTGELSTAFDLINEVTEIHRRRPGEQHKLAACLSKLGSIQLALGDPEQARNTLHTAREIYEDVYGVDHPYVAKVLSRLGPAELAGGYTTLAERTLQRAQDILVATFGGDYPALAWILESSADIHELRDDHDAAMALRDRAAAIHRMAET